MTQPGSNVRALAVRIARRRRRDGEFLEDVLDRMLDSAEGRALDPRDRGLLTELVLGSCRRRVTLDYLLAKFASRPIDRIQPELLEILRQAVYQMVFLSRVPTRAAVAEAVDLAKTLSNTALGGFANAVLRALAGAIEDRGPSESANEAILVEQGFAVRFRTGVLPDPERDPVECLSVVGSMPRVLVERWLVRWDRCQVRRILAASNEVPGVYVHPNGLRTDEASLSKALAAEGRELIAGAVEGFWRIRPSEGLKELAAFREGLFWVMDPAGARAVRALAPRPGERLLDLCSAPGGKVALAAEAMGDRGEIVAIDISAARLLRVTENLQRLGVSSVRILEKDSRQVDKRTGGLFDGVLADVPCSNTGVLRRRVEARHRFLPDNLKQLKELQTELLRAAVRVARPGGRVVYSTCSIEPEENEEVVREVAEGSGSLEVQEMRTFPPEPTGADGGFVARLVVS